MEAPQIIYTIIAALAITTLVGSIIYLLGCRAVDYLTTPQRKTTTDGYHLSLWIIVKQQDGAISCNYEFKIYDIMKQWLDQATTEELQEALTGYTKLTLDTMIQRLSKIADTNTLAYTIMKETVDRCKNEYPDPTIGILFGTEAIKYAKQRLTEINYPTNREKNVTH